MAEETPDNCAPWENEIFMAKVRKALGPDLADFMVALAKELNRVRKPAPQPEPEVFTFPVRPRPVPLFLPKQPLRLVIDVHKEDRGYTAVCKVDTDFFRQSEDRAKVLERVFVQAFARSPEALIHRVIGPLGEHISAAEEEYEWLQLDAQLNAADHAEGA